MLNINVLVIGRGGREHAICKKLRLSKSVGTIYVAPGNAGTNIDAINIDINESDVDQLIEFVKKNKIDLTIVGPENALENGIVDEFIKHDLKIFGPTKNAVKIESSKSYGKQLMEKYDIPTATYMEFDDYETAKLYVEKISFPHVIKYDGLALGKGVVICNNLEEMLEQLDIMLKKQKYGSGNVIIEEYLEGLEFTVLSLVNGDLVIPLPVSRDYKRVFDNDCGNNTGGMGAICPVVDVTKEELEQAHDILNRTSIAMLKENNSFTGVLYGGFIKTDNGVKVIEFNARFGDPETEVVLLKLKNDLYDLITNVLNGNRVDITVNEGHYVGVCLASIGYPGEYTTGVTLPKSLVTSDFVCSMATKEVDNGFESCGGRVALVTAGGTSETDATHKVYERIKQLNCLDLHYRKDIGKY